jgi:hypothetical protein
LRPTTKIKYRRKEREEEEEEKKEEEEKGNAPPPRELHNHQFIVLSLYNL